MDKRDGRIYAHDVVARVTRPLGQLVGYGRVAVARGADEFVSFDVPIDSGLDFERKSSAALSGTEDRQEGVAAFIEKRKGTFKGR